MIGISAATAQLLLGGECAVRTLGYVWDPNTLAYEVMTSSASGIGTDVNVKNSSIPITASSLPLPTGAALEAGHLATIDTSAAKIPAQGQALAAGSMPVVLTAIQVAALTPPVAVAKGTQGATAMPTQDLKDSGRSTIMITAEFSPVAVAEAMLTLSKSADGAAPTTGTSLVITSGKRFRITSWTVTSENTLGVNPKRNKLRLRFAATGGALITSPLQANLVSSVGGTVNTVGTPAFDNFPDGMEFLGDGTKAFGISNESPDWVTAAQTSKLYLTLHGFEY